MDDQKYAGLPGIVYDQPDVYETSDLPESEQEFHDAESGDSNPGFEILHITGTEAYEKFKGKSINASDVDFSDRISRQSRTGYLSNRPIEWSIGADEEETLVQKYQRLQCEVTSLQQEVQQIKDPLPHGSGTASASELCLNVDQLRSSLLNLDLENTLGQDVFSSIAEPEAALHKKLVNLMENFKNTSLGPDKKGKEKSKSQTVAPKAGAEPGGMTYELFYAPEHAKLNQMSRAAQLEKKLDRLEALIGGNDEKMSSLSTWTNHKSLVGAVQVLSSRVSLLEPSHLDHIEGRLHSVHTRMNALATDRKTLIEDADKQTKVSELYDMMKKCEVLCAALPEVVDRLDSVQDLHHEALQFSRSVKQLDSSQTQIGSSLETNEALLSAVQEKFNHNLVTIHDNMQALQDRIQKIGAK